MNPNEVGSYYARLHFVSTRRQFLNRLVCCVSFYVCFVLPLTGYYRSQSCSLAQVFHMTVCQLSALHVCVCVCVCVCVLVACRLMRSLLFNPLSTQDLVRWKPWLMAVSSSSPSLLLPITTSTQYVCQHMLPYMSAGGRQILARTGIFYFMDPLCTNCKPLSRVMPIVHTTCKFFCKQLQKHEIRKLHT